MVPRAPAGVGKPHTLEFNMMTSSRHMRLEFQNDDAVCCFRTKKNKIFTRACGTCINYPYNESKTSKISSFRFCLRRAENWYFLTLAVWPNSGKFLRAPISEILAFTA